MKGLWQLGIVLQLHIVKLVQLATDCLLVSLSKSLKGSE